MKTYDMSRMSRWKISILLLLALGMLFCFGLISRLEHFTREAPLYLSYYSIAFTLYVFACLLLWKVDLEEYQGLLIAVFTAAILFRVLFWFTQPSLSTDVWRYIWDGRLVSQGVNPYLERVDTLIVDREAELLRSRVQHQWMASPYPPAAQAAFGIIYSIFPMSATAMQITFSLIDLASGVLLVRILTRLRLPSGRALLYLWNPLVVIEFAHSGHLDSLMILLVLMAILSSLNGRQNVSAVSLGLATVTKYIPALFLPLFIRRWGWKKLWIYFSIITIAYLPFVRAGLGLDATAGTGLFGAARIYARQWSTNGFIYIWFVNIVRNFGVTEPELIVKGITVLALAMLGLWLLSLPERKQTHDAGMIIEAMTILFSVYLLLSAAVFPWYLTLMVALAAALPVYQSRPWRLVVIAWIYFSGAVNLSYLFYINPANPGEIEWVLRVEYIPLLILLAAAVVLKLIESRQAAAKRNMLS